MKKFFTLLFALVAMSAFADNLEYSFQTSVPSPWVASAEPNGYETSGSSRGAQWTTNATLTLSGAKSVTSVTVIYSCNIASGNSFEVSVGGSSWGTVDLVKETLSEKTFTGDATDGDIVISLTRTSKSIYISKVIVEGVVENEGGGGDVVDVELEEDYAYGEPTTSTVSGDLCSNTAYSFIQNNVKVSATAGAQTETYFGCNAGCDITFTTTKLIKGVVINGYVKKDFAAEADNGTISYVDASEAEVEADPVVVLTDVDAKSVTISCVKQMRCYSVEFYFEANPEVTIDDATGGEDDEEGDYNYDWEPTEATTLDLTFDYLEYNDYTSELGYSCTEVYFSSDDYMLDLIVYVTGITETGIAPGTYEITNTYEDGTIQASPGGDDYYDYPSFLCTDFDAEGYYSTAYYLVSGTLTVSEDASGVKMVLDAKTYNGSTVKATYVGEVVNDIKGVKTSSDNAVRKIVKDGKILIQKGDVLYNLQGMKVQK